MTTLLAGKAEADGQLAALAATDAKIAAAEIISNKYTNLTSNDARTSYDQFYTSLGKRKDLLEAEIGNEAAEVCDPGAAQGDRGQLQAL